MKSSFEEYMEKLISKNPKQPENEKGKKYITTCIFRLKSIPAALYKCLGGFATNQVNLTKLESFWSTKICCRNSHYGTCGSNCS